MKKSLEEENVFRVNFDGGNGFIIRIGISGIRIVEEDGFRFFRRFLKRMSSLEKWETK